MVDAVIDQVIVISLQVQAEGGWGSIFQNSAAAIAGSNLVPMNVRVGVTFAKG